MTVDEQLVALARRQHGVVATRQLLGLGISRARISRLVAKGWLRPIHRGVYLVGPIHGSGARLMAATLAVGDGAVLSHRSAAELWGVGPVLEGDVAVTVIGRSARPRAGIAVHAAVRVDREDVAWHHGIPVTAPARTLLDCGTCVGRRELARAIEEAELRGLLPRDWLDPLLTRNPRHRGASALRVVAAAAEAPAMTRSEAERCLLDLVQRADLPVPLVNQRLHGLEVDFLWRAHRLVVEVDGYAFHSSRSSFERDRRRDAQLIGNGYRVVRLTWHRLTREPEAVIALLAALVTA